MSLHHLTQVFCYCQKVFIIFESIAIIYYRCVVLRKDVERSSKVRWWRCRLFQYPFVRYLLCVHFITLQNRRGRQGFNTCLCIASLLLSFSISCTDRREEQHERRGGYDVENYQFFPVHLIFTHPTVNQN